MTKPILWMMIALFTSLNVWARYDVVVNKQTVEEETLREARKKALDNALKQVTLEKVSGLIGEKRAQENRKIILSQVLKDRNRYIPSYRIGKTKKMGSNHHFEIEVRVSMRDLKSILRQKGLFSSGRRTGLVLPFVEYNDHVNGESYRWWQPLGEVSRPLEAMGRVFEKEVTYGFSKRGLLVMKPQTFSMVNHIPEFMQKSLLTQTEKVQVALLLQSQLYMEGKIDILDSPVNEQGFRIRMQLRCNQAGNGKNVAEVVRSIDTPVGQKPSELRNTVRNMTREAGVDLANQIFDLWQRGALEAQVFQLAVTGELNHQDLVKFKKSLSSTVNGIQGVRERLFEPGRVTFEIDYSGGSIESLRGQLNRAQFEGFLSQVVATNAKEVILDVKPR